MQQDEEQLYAPSSLFGGESSDIFDSGFADLSVFSKAKNNYCGFDLYRARADLFEGKNVYASAYDDCGRGMEDSAPIFGRRHDSYCDGFNAEQAVVAETKLEEVACCGEDSDSQESSLVTDELLESSDNEVYVP